MNVNGGLLFATLLPFSLCPGGMEARQPSPSLEPQLGELLLYSKPWAGIYLQRGEEAERIAFPHGQHVLPRLCPDGQTFLFNSERGGTLGIWLADLNGENRRRICDGAQAAWSSNGQKIVFVRKGTILERHLHSGEERRLSPAGWDEGRFPSFMSDGRVLWVSRNKGKSHLILLDPQTQTERVVLIEGEIHSAPEGSPDGETIAFQNGAHLYLLSLESGTVSQLTLAGGVQSWPMWSRDGRSLCYCQSPRGGEGPWDVYHIEIGKPQEAKLVVRDVEPGAHWRGYSPPTSTTTQLPGTAWQVWQLGPEAELPGPTDGAPGWHRLSAETTGLVEGGVAIQNDWGVLGLQLQASRAVLWSSTKEPSIHQVHLGWVLPGNEEAASLSSIHIECRDTDRLVLKASYRSHSGNGAEVRFGLSRTTPVIEIAPAQNVVRIQLRVPLKLALVPDRLANDLIIRPRQVPGPEGLLPATPLLISPLDSGLLTVFGASDRHDFWLKKGRSADSFEGMDVAPAGERIYLSLLAGDNLCYRSVPARNQDSDGKGWQVEKPDLFLAQWRLAVAGKEGCYARMWGEEALSDLQGPHLPLPSLPGRPDTAVLYTYGRAWHTPLNVLTPTDLLRDSLGLERTCKLLDEEGVRGYRTAQPSVPRRLLRRGRTSPDRLDFEPILRLLGGRYFSILGGIHWGGIEMVRREGVEESVDHLTGDILRLLAGLDDRIWEYRVITQELGPLCRQNPPPASGRHSFAPFAQKRLPVLRERLAATTVTPLEEVKTCIEAIRGCFGTGGSLGEKAEFKRFCHISRTGLKERQTVLRYYRTFVQALRDEAGLAIVQDPTARGLCEQVRRRTGEVLRNRYYLEGDWRGEIPR